MNSNRKVLIVGANGFIGNHVCAAFREAGFEVLAGVRSPESQLDPVYRRVLIPNLEDVVECQRTMIGLNAVINVAGVAHTATRLGQAYEKANVRGPAALVEAADRSGVPTFIHLSSIAAASEAYRAASASSRKLTDYGSSKLRGEREILAGPKRGTGVLIVRAPMVYGPGMRGNPLRLFRHIMRELPVPFAPAENRRSLIYVGNLANALLTAVEHGASRPGLYNVADDPPVSSRAFVLAAADILRKRARIVTMPIALLRTVGYFGDLFSGLLDVPVTSATIDGLIGDLIVDSSDFRKDFGWTTPVDFNTAMAITGNWYREVR